MLTLAQQGYGWFWQQNSEGRYVDALRLDRGGVVYFSRMVQCQNPIVRRTQMESRVSKVQILS
ncbi:hypothetical protein D9736_17525 [Escherichia sp. E10V10]|nr:hypothetical protein D9736_17525 [Escherichia sp. E10V10]